MHPLFFLQKISQVNPKSRGLPTANRDPHRSLKINYLYCSIAHYA